MTILNPKTPEYTAIKTRDVETLILQVNEALKEGWLPSGSLVGIHLDLAVVIFVQPMVRNI